MVGKATLRVERDPGDLARAEIEIRVNVRLPANQTSTGSVTIAVSPRPPRYSMPLIGAAARRELDLQNHRCRHLSVLTHGDRRVAASCRDARIDSSTDSVVKSQ